MANSERSDLMALGQHCAHPDCRQLDFLPFQCSRCSKVYCLEHRVCSCSDSNRETVLVCPICARAVVCPPGEDVELVFDRHTRIDCDPSNYDRVHKKRRCPVPNCKEKLTSINEFQCKNCGVTVCLKHRLAADHKCPGKAATAAAAAQSRLHLPESFRRMFSSGGGGGSSSAPPRAQQKPAAAAAAAANGSSRPSVGQRAAAAAAKTRESIQSQLQQYRQQQQQRGQPRPPPPRPSSSNGEVIDLTDSSTPARAAAGAGTGGAELCQQCGARFVTVQQLIEHAEAAHAGGWSSGAIGTQPAAAAVGGGGLERCPHCGMQFGDAVQLVAHVERQHAGGSSRDNCVLC